MAALGVAALQRGYLIGPVIIALAFIPAVGLLLASRPIRGAVPDIVFGSIDTGLLTIPAISGGVIGDALTDAIAGFFEGGVAQWLRARGMEESREAVTTSLGKMSGCLIGSGAVLSAALLFGVEIRFG